MNAKCRAFLRSSTVMAAIPNAGAHVESSIEPADWTQDLCSPALEAVEGKVEVPSGPAWGVTISPEWLAAADRRRSEVWPTGDRCTFTRTERR